MSYHTFFDYYMEFCEKHSKQMESTLEWVNRLLYPQNQNTIENTNSGTEEARRIIEGHYSSDYEDDENGREMIEMNEDENHEPPLMDVSIVCFAHNLI